MVAGLRSIAKAMELPPEPNVRAPALDPTCERLGVKSPGATRQRRRTEIRGRVSEGRGILFGKRGMASKVWEVRELGSPADFWIFITFQASSARFGSSAIPGPQERGTGGTLICGLVKISKASGAPHARTHIRCTNGGLRPGHTPIIAVSSPVPNCEGPVAPSSGLGQATEIVATRQ